MQTKIEPRKNVGVSMCFHVCCAFERTSTEATISNVTGQSSPHHGKECGELGDQHKHIPF